MPFTRTRIWRGGAPELGLPSESPAPGSQPLAPAPAQPVTEHSVEPGAAPRHEAAGDYIAGFEPGAARELAATRFMPIEALFPEAGAGARADPQLPPRALTPVARRAPRLTGLHARIAVAALVFLLLGAKLVSSFSGARQRTAPASAIPERSAQPPAAPAARASAEAAPAPAASAPPGLERAAIDALVAGDFARAEQRYTQLASGAYTSPALREALRILRARRQAAARP